MKKYKDLYFPDGDEATPPAVYNEWENKGEKICNMVKNKDTVVQAGGNAGLFPIKLSEYFQRVITFEPIPETYQAFQQNLADRPHIKSIELHRMGLGSAKGAADKVVIDSKNHGANQIHMSNTGSIPVVPLDSLELRNVNLIWFDIEGSEVEALKGAVNTINSCKPIIVLENKGLIPGFGGSLEGAPKVVDWMKETFNYVKIDRLMRDDIFAPQQ
jgi:FkbM family methyltransferase